MIRIIHPFNHRIGETGYYSDNGGWVNTGSNVKSSLKQVKERTPERISESSHKFAIITYDFASSIYYPSYGSGHRTIRALNPLVYTHRYFAGF